MRQTDAIAFDFFLPRCGDSISPGVNAFWGKEGCVSLYKVISRNVYNEGAASLQRFARPSAEH
jgi:hypothetical protein